MEYIESCEIRMRGILVGDLKFEDFPDPKVELIWIDGLIKTRNTFKNIFTGNIEEGQHLTLNWTYLCCWAEACHEFLYETGDYVEIKGTLQKTKVKNNEDTPSVYVSVKSINKLNPDGSVMDWETLRSDYLTQHSTLIPTGTQTHNPFEENVSFQPTDEELDHF